jgi:hypothetical protein
LLQWSADAPKGENAVPEPAISYLGFSFDIGASYVIREIMEENDLRFGISFLNLNQPSVASNGSADATLPSEISFGAAYLSHKYDYCISSGITMRDDIMRVMVGTEISALKTDVYSIESEFIVRVGVGRAVKNNVQGDYNGGFGIRINDFSLDYSYSYQSEIRNVGGINSISLRCEF